MAVKQNNTETNGATGSISGSANNGNKTSSGSANGVNTAAKVLNNAATANDGLVNVTNTHKTLHHNHANNIGGAEMNGHADDSESARGSGEGDNGRIDIDSRVFKENAMDIESFVTLLTYIEQNSKKRGDLAALTNDIILMLSRVPVPNDSAQLKLFKDHVKKVGAFFAKYNDGRSFFHHLTFVFHVITQDATEPSCAIAIIFELFNDELICDAVQGLFELKPTDHSIRKCVNLLCKWIRTSSLCQNLNFWIMNILRALQERQSFELYNQIALDNVKKLFYALMVPVLRPSSASLVLHMLQNVVHTPTVFHVIIPIVPRVLTALIIQSNSTEPYAEQTKIILQQFVDILSALMIHYPDYEDLYKEMRLAIKDYSPSNSFMSYFQDTTPEQDLQREKHNFKVGLVNLGNTCYMNSVLQALAMTRVFSREILLVKSSSPTFIKMQQQIALMLYSIRYELTPSRLLNATRPPGFVAGVQQDSSEFLGYLLDTLHEQEVAFRVKTAQPLAKVRDNDDTESVEMQLEDEQVHAQVVAGGEMKKMINFPKTESSMSICSTQTEATFAPAAATENSTIDKTFAGKLATIFTCLSCSFRSCNVDTFRELQLSFPEVKDDCAMNYSVQDLIDYYCSPEKMDGDNQYFCENCHHKTDAVRNISIITAPKNLILTLKQFKYDQKYHMRAKLMHKVFHDEKLSVKVISASSYQEVASVHYDLYAGVVHSGFSMDSGHYITYAADAAHQWFKFNDNIVTASESEELHNLTPPNTPYILFYQMSARCDESLPCASSSDACSPSSKIYKVDMPEPLSLSELPCELRDYVHHDNSIYSEEMRKQRFKNKISAANPIAARRRRGGGNNDEDDDNEGNKPPPSGSCGDNLLNNQPNRFIY